MLAESQRLQTEIDDILVELSGDETRENRNVFTPPSISERVTRIVNSQWDTTSAPTQTARDGYAWAANAFAKELDRLKALAADLEAFENSLETAGAPLPRKVVIGDDISSDAENPGLHAFRVLQIRPMFGHVFCGSSRHGCSPRFFVRQGQGFVGCSFLSDKQQGHVGNDVEDQKDDLENPEKRVDDHIEGLSGQGRPPVLRAIYQIRDR